MSSPHLEDRVGILLQSGAWLGVDVGSRRTKVADLCLIESDGRRVSVRFERGIAADPYPARNDAASMLTPGHDRLSLAARRGLVDLLASSSLVARWQRAVDSGSGPAVVAIDAPPGFADSGQASRATEGVAWSSFRTPPEATFFTRLARFARAGNETPLRQQFYWKLVGVEMYRWFAAAAGLDIAPPAATVTAGRVRLRETFPSDVYQRADGALGTLAPVPRALLARLVSGPWQSERVASVTWRGLLAHRRDALRQALESGQSLEAMSKLDAQGRKLSAAWADLFDAFTCAYAACAEDHGCGRLLGTENDSARCRREGSILSVVTQPQAR